MKLRKTLSVLAASVLSLTCVPFSAVAADVDTVSEAESEPETIIPDFPDEVFDQFNLSKEYGIASNQYAEDTEGYYFGCYHEMKHSGGYALLTEQGYDSVSFGADWYNCDESIFCSDKAYYSVEDTSDDSPELRTEMFYKANDKSTIKAGVYLTMNGGKTHLFIVESTIASDNYSEYEKIGEYELKDEHYDLYKNEDGSMYYSVKASGIISAEDVDDFRMDDGTGYIKFNTSIALHAVNFDKITGEGTSISRMGLRAENSGGIGRVFFNSEVGTLLNMPAKYELETDENGDPVKYEHNIVKNIDGCIYQLNTGDDKSFIIPKGNGAYEAELTDSYKAYVSSGYRFEGNESLLEHNYRVDCEYKTDSNITPAVTVWMMSPNVRIDFVDIPDYSFAHWPNIGSVTLDGQQYNVYRDSIINVDTAPEKGDSYQQFTIDRADSDADAETEGEVKTAFVPVSEIAAIASRLGVTIGNVTAVDTGFRINNSEAKVEVIKNQLTDAEISEFDYDLGAVVGSGTPINIDDYSFDALGVSCYAKANGCVSLSGMTSFYNYCSASKKSKDGAFENLAEYRVEAGPDNECGYSVEYDVYSVEPKEKLKGDDGVYYSSVCLKIIEKTDGRTPDEYMKPGRPLGIGMSNGLRSQELVATYTSNGHEYDLYECVYRTIGCFSSYDDCVYYSFRKDQSEDLTVQEGEVDLSDHIAVIKNNGCCFGDKYLVEYYMDLENQKNADINVVKNDFSTSENKTVRGDINSDQRVNALDIVSARSLYLNRDSLSEEEVTSVDLNMNGTFEIADVVILHSFVLGKANGFTVQK
ncbi:MAG: dockerin type I repeat-containing protein [Ruminococcus sp.]|nr:dockerin type I repeat-containing protein [Ruminococcus sp.]